MDDYLTNSLFAADLLLYLFKKEFYPWENPYAKLSKEDRQKSSQFNSDIGDAVYTIWKKNHDDIELCYCELRRKRVADKELFAKYATSAAHSYFTKGYSHGSFLGFCAIVLGVAVFYYEYPCTNGVPETAADVVALVLLSHQLTEELFRFLCSKSPSSLFDIKMNWRPDLSILQIEKEIDVSCFNEKIGFAVFYVIKEKEEYIFNCFDEFIEYLHEELPDCWEEAYFARSALQIAPLYFTEGYSHEAFLGYCALVIGVAYNYLVLKPNNIPQLACQVVSHVLFTHQMTGQFYEERGWQGLYDVSSNFTKCMKDLHQNRRRRKKSNS